MQRVEAQHRTTICHKISVYWHWAHSVLPPCYHWCVVASRDLAVDRFRPTSLRAPSLSNRAGSQERQTAVLTCSILPSSSSQQLASLPNIPTHRLECQPVSPTGSWVWQCWLQGSDGLLIGPSAQQPHEGGQRGWGRQVCLCSTCCPPHTTTTTPLHRG